MVVQCCFRCIGRSRTVIPSAPGAPLFLLTRRNAISVTPDSWVVGPCHRARRCPSSSHRTRRPRSTTDSGSARGRLRSAGSALPCRAPHADVERAVLPDDVVVQLWVRGAPAASVARRSRGIKVSGRTCHRRRQIRRQLRAVLNRHDAGGLRRRCRHGPRRRTGAVRAAGNAAGPLTAGPRSAPRKHTVPTLREYTLLP
jgi:hypothetical protein